MERRKFSGKNVKDDGEKQVSPNMQKNRLGKGKSVSCSPVVNSPFPYTFRQLQGRQRVFPSSSGYLWLLT